MLRILLSPNEASLAEIRFIQVAKKLLQKLSRVINTTRRSVSLDNHSTLLCNFRLKISDTCSLFTIYKEPDSENPVGK